MMLAEFNQLIPGQRVAVKGGFYFVVRTVTTPMESRERRARFLNRSDAATTPQSCMDFEAWMEVAHAGGKNIVLFVQIRTNRLGELAPYGPSVTLPPEILERAESAA